MFVGTLEGQVIWVLERREVPTSKVKDIFQGTCLLVNAISAMN